MIRYLSLAIVVASACTHLFAQSFVSAKAGSFQVNNRPYYFVGTNYWYGSLLALETDKKRGIERLEKELDFLKRNGVTNLRLMAGAEGSGLLNGVMRVGPALQPEPGKFDERVLDGLDLVLAEMAKRDMKAVIFLSNNWEWSGGWQQYLIWNGSASTDLLTRKPSWDELRDVVSKFYSCGPCMDAYMKQVELVLSRTNKLTKKKYLHDPTIMAWELANEPRPMRPAANEPYVCWIRDVAAAIKSRDKHHLVRIGHEGSIGTESMELFERVHSDPNIDYLTIHIWPKNWGWLEEGFPVAVSKTVKYIEEHIVVARRLTKPLVFEEFGLPRDGLPQKRGDAEKSTVSFSFEPGSPTSLRDEYYRKILSYVGKGVAGANFWAFGGTARPIKGQVFWKRGDQRMGDPPMEEQGLNSVFDVDRSTWNVIRRASVRSRSVSAVNR
jgi:mannan endo-1,4-beta-mannosidase